MIRATLRTNFYRDRPFLSFKLDPAAVPEMPAPRPRFEIFVYSPRVEGVHLRYGPVARGGLRWSDRPQDFRTEILGLVKAQAVKNAVIVPVGAKGGFVVRRPEAGGDEVVACYRTFISGCSTSPTTSSTARDRAAPGRRPPRRRRLLPRGRRRQGHGEVLRHRERGRGVLRLLARRRVRLRRLGGLRPQGHGHHRPRRVGEREAALPRAGRRHPARGVHRRRDRRHVRRRVRQRHAALAPHPAGRRVRPPARLRRPDPRRRARVRRAGAAVRAAALVVGRLRPRRDQRRRRGVAAHGQVRARRARDARGAGHRRGRHAAQPARADPRDPARPGGPAVERRRRHLRQGERRDPRRRRGQGQRRHPRRRPGAAREGRRGGRQPRADPAGPHRVRPRRRAAQHRRDRQLRGRRLQRPRGQHQDPAGPARHGGGAGPRRAQRAARGHDRRGRRAGARRQPRAERAAGRRARARGGDGPRPPAVRRATWRPAAGSTDAWRCCPTTPGSGPWRRPGRG